MRRIVLVISLILLSFSSYSAPIDSCSYYRRKCDTLSHRLYMDEKKIAKVKFYLAICKKKPSQTKFLRGWIIRAVK